MQRTLVGEYNHRGVDWRILERPDAVREFTAEINGQVHMVEFYDIRNDAHKPTIARRIANLETFTAHGHGVSGFGQVIPIEGRDRDYYADVFYRAKPERKGKIPMLGTPKLILDIVDKHAVHLEYRHIFTRENLEEFFAITGTRHLVVPLLGEVARIHPNLTTGPKSKSPDWSNSGLPQNHWVDVPTACVVVLPDKDWFELADMVTNENPRAFMAITSMNIHSVMPKMNSIESFEYYIDFVLDRVHVPFTLGVSDSVFEGDYAHFETSTVNPRSSHEQNRFALVGEEPALYVHRNGHMTANELEMRLNRASFTKGRPIKVVQLVGATDAKSDYHEAENHGDRLMRGIELANADYARRHVRMGYIDLLSIIHIGPRRPKAA